MLLMKIRVTHLPPSKCTGVLSTPTMLPPPYISILSLMRLTPDQSHIGARQLVNGMKKIVFSNCTKAVNSSIPQKVKLLLMPEHVFLHLLQVGGSKHVCFREKQHLWGKLCRELPSMENVGVISRDLLATEILPTFSWALRLAVHLQDETWGNSLI